MGTHSSGECEQVAIRSICSRELGIGKLLLDCPPGHVGVSLGPSGSEIDASIVARAKNQFLSGGRSDCVDHTIPTRSFGPVQRIIHIF